MLEQEWLKSHEDKLTPKVRAALSSLTDPEEKIKVIIEFEDRHQYGRNRVRRAIRKLGGTVCCELPLVNSLAVEIPAGALQEFIPNHHPKMIWADSKVKGQMDVAVPTIHGDVAYQNDYTGKGVVVAVIDTGIDPHPDLTEPRNRIVGWKDFVNNKRRPYDDNGHGTHVAGIIAGNGRQSGGKYRGVAPEARLVGVKVLDEEGSGSASQVIAGVQWVVQNRRRYRIRVVNMSMGATAEEGYLDDPISQAVEAAWASGLTVCVAAGNEGPKGGTIATPGIAPSVITVGNMDDQETVERNDDEVADSSSRGPTIDQLAKPDILAPGTNIMSLKNGGGYIAHSGTSMATPMVSGAVALLLQQNPRLTPPDIKAKLMAAAENRNLPADAQGAGYLDLLQPLGLEVGSAPIAPERKPAITKQDLIDVLMKVLPHFVPPSQAKFFQRMMPLMQTLAAKVKAKDGKDESVKAAFKPEDITQKILAMLPMLLGTTGITANPWQGLLQSLKQWMVFGSESPA